MKGFKGILIAAFLLFIGTSLQAQQRGPRGGQGMKVKMRFNKIDADGNKRISFDEISSLRKNRKARGNENRQGRMRSLFDKFDTNNDGSLKRKEFRGLKKALKNMRAQDGPRQGQGGPRGGGRKGPGPRQGGGR